MIDKKWYVVRALSGKEKQVKERLENEINRMGFSELISQVIIPTEKVYQVRKGKPIHKEKNLFPGYILVNTVLDGEIKHFIKSITGIVGFLGEKNGKIDPLRDDEVARILGKMDELSETDEEINNPFIVGEPVKITDGAFNGLNGFVEEVYEDKKRLKVMVKIFERKVPVELRFMQVEKE
ncbi:MAG: transcription termination/antitermination protein NusG [Bacteroidales bacterium]|jgi:transcriptional antiterminator NusG|nr:transcription termination/antitermination protein NusG [Bacteroidales bacterium]